MDSKLTKTEAQALLYVIDGARKKCGEGEDDIGCIAYYNNHAQNPLGSAEAILLLAKLHHIAGEEETDMERDMRLRDLGDRLFKKPGEDR